MAEQCYHVKYRNSNANLDEHVPLFQLISQQHPDFKLTETTCVMKVEIVDSNGDVIELKKTSDYPKDPTRHGVHQNREVTLNLQFGYISVLNNRNTAIGDMCFNVYVSNAG